MPISLLQQELIKGRAHAGGGIKLHHAQPLRAKSLYTSKEIKLEWNLIQGELFKWGFRAAPDNSCEGDTFGRSVCALSPPARRLLRNSFLLFSAHCGELTTDHHGALKATKQEITKARSLTDVLSR